MTIIAKITLLSEDENEVANLRKEFKTSLVPTVGAFLLDPGLTDADGLVHQREIIEVILDTTQNVYEITLDHYQLKLSESTLEKRVHNMEADNWELIS